MCVSLDVQPERTRRVAVTGATGFIGRGVIRALEASVGFGAVRCVRADDDNQSRGAFSTRVVGNIGAQTDWREALQGCDAVIHTAGRAHVSSNEHNTAATTFQSVNVDGTRRLAEQAAESGVRRLVFLSSVGVYGGETLGIPWNEETPLRPENAYARSKCDAEAALKSIAANTGLETVIIRPPLVYGPGTVPGNFGRLVRIVRKGVPLPFASLKNARSFIARDTLVDLILTCIDHPNAANEVFLASDDDDQSTAEIVRAIANGLDRPARLWPVPPSLLTLGLGAIGRGSTARQLCGSLRLDISKVKACLDWHPPAGFHASMKRAMQNSGPSSGECDRV